MMKGTRALAALMVFAGAAVLAGAALAGSGGHRSFSGHMFDEPGTRIKLTVEVRHGQLESGRFSPRRVFVACGSDLQLNSRVALPATRIKFIDRNTFSADTYMSGESTGVESYLHVRGDVNLKKGTAEGELSGFVNPLPDAVGYEEPECTTRGLARWVATDRAGQGN